ncbi:MAG: phosphate/phosphite/phosphonate ABC transporter substrate-binding protein, partial [Candidatus Omnitrophota bacterium]|nr:phosphate/phosphite/phosphonate ABC transporter substrate-binding protein [Candidatus Omnitrophota bacterium]
MRLKMIRNGILSGCFIFIMLFSFAGCGDKEDIKKIDLNKTEEIKDTFQDTDSLRIGLIPEQDIRKMAERYEPLAEYLSKKLNLKVNLIYMDSYGEICDKFINKELDAAFFGSLSYVLTHAKAGVEPVARPDYGGISTYRGLVIVRSGEGITNAQDMKNKRLALVHHATYAGYLYPLYYFKTNGIHDFETYFSKVMFAGSHDKAISDVLRGEADIAIAKDLVYQRMIKENPDLEKRLTVLAASEGVPSNTLCVGRELDPAMKTEVKKILVNMAGDETAKPALEALGGASGFVGTEDADYRPLYAVIRELGIDLNTYPYYD